MQLAVEIVGDVAVAAVPVDELDASNAAEFKRDIAPLLEANTKLVLDLSRLRFVDSSGLGAFISCLRKLNAKGGDLKLYGMSKQVTSGVRARAHAPGLRHRRHQGRRGARVRAGAVLMAAVLQYVVFLLVIVVLWKPMGGYMARVFERQRTWPDALLLRVERAVYRLTGVDAQAEMSWKEYAAAFILFSGAGTLLLFFILRLQQVLPWSDPRYLTTPLTPDLAVNTAISFSTTTTWQAYGGETTMSYFAQLAGLAAQNFLAGAAGLAVGVAFIRGLARERADRLGNFWVDLVRGLLWILLPLSVVGSLLLVWQGVPLNFSSYTKVTTLEGGSQIIAQGPVAALEFIKNLGTNGGGFFNANGAHPYENPTPLSNVVEMLAIAVLPAAFVNTFGRMTNRPRDARVIFAAMISLFAAGVLVCDWAERRGAAIIAREAFRAPHETMVGTAGGNMEGKETRFGVAGSVLAGITTSNGATGSYNSMHDSSTPLVEPFRSRTCCSARLSSAVWGRGSTA